MVTINPAATSGASALAIETRTTTRPTLSPLPRENSEARASDSVEVSDAAAWRAARDSVREGVSQVRTALSIGEEAQAFLAKVQELAKSDDPNAEDELTRLATECCSRVDAVIKGGGILAAGGSISVQAEPGSAPLSIAGLDLTLGGGLIKLGLEDTLAEAGDAARTSLPGLQGGLDRLTEALRGLEAHQGFLGAAEIAVNANLRDLDADSARLLALQVRQELDASGGAIANVEPQAVLSLFRG